MALQRRQQLLSENNSLRTLLGFLAMRPEPEALEILRQLRTTGDPMAVLDFVRQGDLLLQQHPGGAAAAAVSDEARLGPSPANAGGAAIGEPGTQPAVEVRGQGRAGIAADEQFRGAGPSGQLLDCGPRVLPEDIAGGGHGRDEELPAAPE